MLTKNKIHAEFDEKFKEALVLARSGVIKLYEGTEITQDEFIAFDWLTEGIGDTIKSFYDSKIQEMRLELKVKIAKKAEVHKHNSVPSYTADLENGCVVCVRNQAIDDILKEIGHEEVW